MNHLIKETATFHIGGPKTGSTAIQVWLAQNRDFLNKRNVHYPKSGSDKKAMHNRIVSGNGHVWATNPSSVEVCPGDLWSNEHLFFSDEFKKTLSKRSEAADFPIQVVGYYRDPIPWAVSRWMQSLKREGGIVELDTFLENSGTFLLNHLLSWLEFAQHSSIDVRLYNYENHKERLIEHFVKQLLGLEFENNSIEQNTGVRVNRSLNSQEASMLLQINIAKMGEPELGRQVSDYLVESFPLLETGTIFPSHGAVREFSNKSTPVVNKINALLPNQEKIRVPDADSYSQ